MYAAQQLLCGRETKLQRKISSQNDMVSNEWYPALHFTKRCVKYGRSHREIYADLGRPGHSPLNFLPFLFLFCPSPQSPYNKKSPGEDRGRVCKEWVDVKRPLPLLHTKYLLLKSVHMWWVGYIFCRTRPTPLQRSSSWCPELHVSGKR